MPLSSCHWFEFYLWCPGTGFPVPRVSGWCLARGALHSGQQLSSLPQSWPLRDFPMCFGCHVPCACAMHLPCIWLPSLHARSLWTICSPQGVTSSSLDVAAALFRTSSSLLCQLISCSSTKSQLSVTSSTKACLLSPTLFFPPGDASHCKYGDRIFANFSVYWEPLESLSYPHPYPQKAIQAQDEA